MRPSLKNLWSEALMTSSCPVKGPYGEEKNFFSTLLGVVSGALQKKLTKKNKEKRNMNFIDVNIFYVVCGNFIEKM